MDQLLEYLGSRADDFKKCFDIESEWCWKYADLVLRGLEKRELEYAEGHHIVPASFYRKRRCSISDDGNLTTLTYGEHLWAHYCMALCAIGKMRGKMAMAFFVMYWIGMKGCRPLMPSEAELFNAIPEMEMRRIQAMEPKWAKVEAEGRTHKCDDPVKYSKDYYESNKEKILKQRKIYNKTNKKKISEQHKAYYESNKEKILEYHKSYREANEEKILESKKASYEANKEKILERNKAYCEANKEKIAEYRKSYHEANKEKISEQMKAYREANKEKISEYRKSYREAKKAAGYRYLTDQVTGKRGWVFVGLPEQEVAA